MKHTKEDDYPETAFLAPYDYPEWHEAREPDDNHVSYTRTDKLPAWRTVGVDGMPSPGTQCIVSCPAGGGEHLWHARDTDNWMIGRADAYDRYIPLSELLTLPGGEK